MKLINYRRLKLLAFKYYCKPYNQKSTDYPCDKKPLYSSARVKCLDCKGAIPLRDTKRCTGCKKELPLADFYKDKSKEDGLATRCRKCKIESAVNRENARQEFADMRLAMKRNCDSCCGREKEAIKFIKGFKFKEKLFKMKKCKRDNCYFLQWSPYIKK
jgi:hypothetical protein